MRFAENKSRHAGSVRGILNRIPQRILNLPTVTPSQGSGWIV